MAIAPLFEVCLQSVDGAIAAQAGGAGRVELCAALVEGGITPSLGSIAACRDAVNIDIMVMIRPRGGDFLYSSAELDSMARDIEHCKAIGVTGVVFGLLQEDGQIDLQLTKQLIDIASPLQLTFHRAFDVVKDPVASLESLIELGVDRVLTSGQAATVPEGLALIKSLVQQSAGRIGILPGCGITAQNVAGIVAQTGVSEFHATAFATRSSAMQYHNPSVYMGLPGLAEYERQYTSTEIVASYLSPWK
ncbi:MAG: copper homeostasis protein CutC [Bacteroidota bacterium]